MSRTTTTQDPQVTLELLALHRQVSQLKADVARLAAGLKALAAIVGQRDERTTTAEARRET